MKKVILCSLCAAIAASSNVSFAKESKIFAKVKVGVGYEMQKYVENSGNIISNMSYWWSTSTYSDQINKFNFAPVISLGGNLYLRLHKYFNPFIGVETQGRLAVIGKEAISCNIKGTVAYNLKFNEFFRSNLKLGSRINFSKNVVIETYALAGLSITQMKYHFESRDWQSIERNISKKKVGKTVGAGMDLIVDRVFVGFEYRYGIVNYGNYEFLDGNVKQNTHSFLLKAGVELF
jgi:opacity protein-like surface antigen